MFGLVGDLGGTNARFAIAAVEAHRPVLTDCAALPAAEFRTPQAAARAYLNQIGIRRPLDFAVFAVAGPVTDGYVRFTNLAWELSAKVMGTELGCDRVRLVNDFTAMAKSVPALSSEDLARIGPDVPGTQGSAVTVLGPGTGFGVSCLVGEGAYETVLSTEGGHVPFAPQSDVERDVLKVLAGQFGRVSVERILSGSGLVSLYHALAEISGRKVDGVAPRDVTSAAATGEALAGKAVDLFCSILGAVAGDFVLAYGARGGVYIAGGIAPRLLNRLVAGPFRNSFEAKGRFVNYLKAVPTQVIMHPYAALIGAGRAAF